MEELFLSEWLCFTYIHSTKCLPRSVSLTLLQGAETSQRGSPRNYHEPSSWLVIPRLKPQSLIFPARKFPWQHRTYLGLGVEWDLSLNETRTKVGRCVVTSQSGALWTELA